MLAHLFELDFLLILFLLVAMILLHYVKKFFGPWIEPDIRRDAIILIVSNGLLYFIILILAIDLISNHLINASQILSTTIGYFAGSLAIAAGGLILNKKLFGQYFPYSSEVVQYQSTSIAGDVSRSGSMRGSISTNIENWNERTGPFTLLFFIIIVYGIAFYFFTESVHYKKFTFTARILTLASIASTGLVSFVFFKTIGLSIWRVITRGALLGAIGWIFYYAWKLLNK